MVTLVERGGRVVLLNAQLKVARPEAAVDDLQDGATGNLIAPVRPCARALGRWRDLPR